MSRRTIVILLLLLSLVLSGCLRNSPRSVATRFVHALRGPNWKKMTLLVNWRESATYVPDLRPIIEGHQPQKEKALKIMMGRFIDYIISSGSDTEIRRTLIMLEVRDVQEIRRTRDAAELRLTVRVSQERKVPDRKFNLTLVKRRRLWRILLMPEYFQ